jgi:hypothetical protein
VVSRLYPFIFFLRRSRIVPPVTVPPEDDVSDPPVLQRVRETSRKGGRWVWLETAVPPALGKETREKRDSRDIL